VAPTEGKTKNRKLCSEPPGFDPDAFAFWDEAPQATTHCEGKEEGAGKEAVSAVFVDFPHPPRKG
jgi:hypothetical protein